MSQLGHEGYLYWGNAPLVPGTVEFNTASQWDGGTAFEMETIAGDIATGGSPVEVDTTNFKLMRQAKTGSVEVATAGEITFNIQVELLTNANMRKLVKANRDKTVIALLDLTAELSVEGAWGTAANYTISFDKQRPLQGVQVLPVRCKLLDNLTWVEVDNGSNLIEVPA